MADDCITHNGKGVDTRRRSFSLCSDCLHEGMKETTTAVGEDLTTCTCNGLETGRRSVSVQRHLHKSTEETTVCMSEAFKTHRCTRTDARRSLSIICQESLQAVRLDIKPPRDCLPSTNAVEHRGSGNMEQKKSSWRSGWRPGTRHSLTFWAFLGFANLYILRVDMNIALVAMASQNSTPTTSGQTECAVNSSSLTSADEVKTEFDWSNTLQGFVLSAFFYGYFVTQIPGSFLANKFGGKRMFAVAMVGCSTLALLTPISARLHVGMLIANRILQGCFQGLVFPAMQLMLSKWVPAKERSRLVAFTYAGCQAGTVIGQLSAGYISGTSAGWPAVFYTEGVLGMAWCLGWIFVIYDSPSEHPRISPEEMAYIEDSVENLQDKAPKTPWRSIFTCPAMYAIAAAHFANDWGGCAIMTCLPRFMKDILNFDMTQNGFLSTLPWLVMWTSNMVAGGLADFLSKPHRLSTAHVRKLMVTIGLIGPACLMLVAAYLPGCGRTVIVVLLTMSTGLSGFTIAGHSVNHLDIAPVFASLLFAMTNSVGTTTGLIGPALAGALTAEHNTRENWETFFLISGGIFAVGGFVFILFARGEIQSWATLKQTTIEVFVVPTSLIPGSTKEKDDDVKEYVTKL